MAIRSAPLPSGFCPRRKVGPPWMDVERPHGQGRGLVQHLDQPGTGNFSSLLDRAMTFVACSSKVASSLPL